MSHHQAIQRINPRYIKYYQSAFSDPGMYSNTLYNLDYFFGWPDDNLLGSKHVTLNIIMCNKFVVLDRNIYLA